MILTIYCWIRAKLYYPVRLYSRELFIENLNKFTFPKDATSSNGRIFFLKRFDDIEKINIESIFGYNEIGVYLYADIIVNNKEYFSAFQEGLFRINRAYKNFKKWFLSYCPNEIAEEGMEFEFQGEKCLVDAFEFFERIEEKEKNPLIKNIKNLDEPFKTEYVFFETKFEEIESRVEIKQADLEDVDESIPMSVVHDRIYFFVYHYFVTYPLSLDPSKGIIEISRIGFIVSLILQDLHVDIKELYNSIRDKKEYLEQLNKQAFLLTLSSLEEDILHLEQQAITTNERLNDTMSLAEKVNESLQKPYINREERPNLSLEISSILQSMDSTTSSIFDAAGLQELFQLGGLRKIINDVNRLKEEFKVLDMKYRRNMNVLSLSLSISLLIIILVTISYLSGSSNISYIADILQIGTFFFALMFILFSILPWITRRFKSK